MEAQQYSYVVGYKIPAAGREGSVGVKADTIAQAQMRALSAVDEKTRMNGVVIITGVRCEGKVKV